MTITADTVRELAARGEGPTLDYKRDDYDWSKKQTNAELAKDLMAIANSLSPQSHPGYILIGVDNNGTLVGVPASSHLDDATLHQKVDGGGWLNRVPTFSYSPVDVGGVSVGVYEIRPGGRPYFALKDSSPSLQKNVAQWRNGSGTATASPTLILEWDREDDPVGRQARELQLRNLQAESRKLEAEARIHASLRHTMISNDAERMLVVLEIDNRGGSGIFVRSLRWRIEWNETFRRAQFEAHARSGATPPLPTEQWFPEGYETPRRIEEIDSRIVPSTQTWRHQLQWSRAEALEHIKASGAQVIGYHGSWIDIHIDAVCEGELGDVATLRYSLVEGMARPG